MVDRPALPRRVLHVVSGLDIGGIETWLYQLLGRLERDRVEVEVLVFSPKVGAYEQKISEMGIRILRCSSPHKPLRMIRELRRLFASRQYHAVHVSLHFFSGLIVREAYRAGVPIRIVHSRNMGDSKRRTLGRAAYEGLMRNFIARYATHRLAVSPEAGELLFGKGSVGPANYQIVPSAIDFDAFRQPVDREEVRREFGLSTDDAIIGHVGRIAPAKNHRLIIDIARAYIAVVPQARFVLVGDGPLREQIAWQVKQYGLEEKVIFLGFQREVPKLLKGLFDVFLFPSLWEGSPRVVVEAQVSGLPVVMSSIISKHMDVVPSLIKRVSLDSPVDDWIRALEWAVDASRRVDKEEAYRRVLESEFSMEEQARRLTNLYHGLSY